MNKESTASNYIEAMARNWNCAFEQYAKKSSRFDMLRYEDFVIDKVGEIEALCQRMDMQVRKELLD